MILIATYVFHRAMFVEDREHSFRTLLRISARLATILQVATVLRSICFTVYPTHRDHEQSDVPILERRAIDTTVLESMR